MIQNLPSDFKTVSAAIMVLAVGDLLIFKRGLTALRNLKDNITTYNGRKKLSIEAFTQGSMLSGNLLKKSPTTLQGEIRAMLMDDDSLVIFRDECRDLNLTVAKRQGKLLPGSLAKLSKGIFHRSMLDISGVAEEVLESSYKHNHPPINLVVPTNAKELYVIKITQTYVDDVVTDGNILSMSAIHNPRKKAQWNI